MVVEDDPGIARVLERGLMAAGYSVEVEADGLVAERTWASVTFDAVILDVMLPGLDGIELCARRRDDGDMTQCSSPLAMTTRPGAAASKPGHRLS